ncbi:hypothetical protein PCE1_002780 [Barthelona sp. PCE]
MEPTEPIVGYTGFIPKMREASLGSTFGTATQKLHTPEMNAVSAPADEPQGIIEGNRTIVGYTGHLPGVQDSFGSSYKKLVIEAHVVEKPKEDKKPKVVVRKPRSDIPKLSKYEVPGYTGYIPGVQNEQFGGTFAATVRNQLDKTEQVRTLEVDDKTATDYETTHPVPENVATLAPGYTGFLPKSQHHFGKTYGQISRECLHKEETPFALH